MTDTIIRARGISKNYRVYDRRSDRFWELLLRRHRHHEFQALKEVSFELARGESLGLVGENGAGKSTLLKILAGIVQPSSGEIEVHGRVASILELGSGFHPEMTGRQNIVLNAAMLGLTEVRLRQRLPDIIAFSELGDFIEQPVKCYSTGMVMRLGFAIATQVDPDILIIDEALAVGDGYFQKKCVDRLQEMHTAGTTFLFCSHAMYFVTTLCSQALWLRGGRIAAHGQSHEVVQEYEGFLHSKETRKLAPGTAPSSRPAATAGTPARLTRVALRDATQTPAVVRPGAPLVIEIEWTSREAGLQYHVGVGINRSDGVVVTFISTLNDGLPAFRGQTSYRVELDLPTLPLTKGEFDLHVFLGDEEGLHVFDQRLLDSVFKIGGDRYTPGLLEIEHRWLLGAEAAIAAPARAAAAGPR